MFKFLPEAKGRTASENASIAASMLADLQGKIDVLLASDVRLNSENADKSNYDLVLTTDFNGFDELHQYAVHPLHLKVVEFIKDVRESRSCVDYEY